MSTILQSDPTTIGANAVSCSHTLRPGDLEGMISVPAGTFAGITGLVQGTMTGDYTDKVSLMCYRPGTGTWISGGTTVTLTDNVADVLRVPDIRGFNAIRFLTNAYTSGSVVCTVGAGTFGSGVPAQPPITLSTAAISATTGTFSGALSATTGTFSGATSSTAHTGTSAVVTAGLNSSGATGAGIGYVTGAGGTVTQITSITTGVTLSKNSGTITTVSSTLAQNAIASFTVTNTAVAATDSVIATIKSYGGTAGGIPRVDVTATAAGSYQLTLKNIGATTLDAVVVITVTVLKGVAA